MIIITKEHHSSLLFTRYGTRVGWFIYWSQYWLETIGVIVVGCFHLAQVAKAKAYWFEADCQRILEVDRWAPTTSSLDSIDDSFDLRIRSLSNDPRIGLTFPSSCIGHHLSRNLATFSERRHLHCRSFSSWTRQKPGPGCYCFDCCTGCHFCLSFSCF